MKLTNFRQFHILDISFHERLTVLIGENGSGKTTILEALEKNMRLYTAFTNKEDPNIRIDFIGNFRQ
jgi:predicted ATP-binding protein involved in virulence